ncbi:MAG: hypothetical protein ACI4WY_04600 [Anaerovoracaceae bacterium]
MNNKREQLDRIKARTYKKHGKATIKTPEQIEKELSALQGSKNQDIMRTYYSTRKGV